MWRRGRNPRFCEAGDRLHRRGAVWYPVHCPYVHIPTMNWFSVFHGYVSVEHMWDVNPAGVHKLHTSSRRTRTETIISREGPDVASTLRAERNAGACSRMLEIPLIKFQETTCAAIIHIKCFTGTLESYLCNSTHPLVVLYDHLPGALFASSCNNRVVCIRQWQTSLTLGPFAPKGEDGGIAHKVTTLAKYCNVPTSWHVVSCCFEYFREPLLEKSSWSQRLI